MYNQNEGKLVRVKSESELKPGRAYVLKDCNRCSKTHNFFLDTNCSDSHVKQSYGFITSPMFNCNLVGRIGPTGDPWCKCEGLDDSIKEGRLFKVVDTFQETDTVVTTKKLVKTKG